MPSPHEKLNLLLALYLVPGGLRYHGLTLDSITATAALDSMVYRLNCSRFYFYKSNVQPEQAN